MESEAQMGHELQGARPYLIRFATAASATFVVVYLASLVLLWESHNACSMSVAAGFLMLISTGVAAALALLFKRNAVALVVATQAVVLILIGLLTTWA